MQPSPDTDKKPTSSNSSDLLTYSLKKRRMTALEFPQSSRNPSFKQAEAQKHMQTCAQNVRWWYTEGGGANLLFQAKVAIINRLTQRYVYLTIGFVAPVVVKKMYYSNFCTFLSSHISPTNTHDIRHSSTTGGTWRICGPSSEVLHQHTSNLKE